MCTVRSARLLAQKERLLVLVSADTFLHHMVRNFVGSLVEIGCGARPPEWMGELRAARDRTLGAGRHRPRGWCSCACSMGLTAELPNA